MPPPPLSLFRLAKSPVQIGLKLFSYSNSFQIWSSLLVLRDRTYSIKVEKPSEPAGTFQICFRYFISFNMKSFFLKNIQNQSNRGCFKNESIYTTLILKNHNVEIHVPLRMHPWYLLQPFKCRAKSTVLTIFHCCAYFNFQFFWIKISGTDKSFPKEADWNAIHVGYWLHSTLKLAVILS